MSTQLSAASDPSRKDGKNSQSTAVLGVVALAFILAILVILVGRAFGSDDAPQVSGLEQVILDPSLDVSIDANIPPATAPTPSTIDIPEVPLDPVVTTTAPPTTTIAPLVDPASLTGGLATVGAIPVSTPAGFVVLSESDTSAVAQRDSSVATFTVAPKSQVGNSASNKLTQYIDTTVRAVLVDVKVGQATPVAVNGFVDAASIELRATNQGTNMPVYTHLTIAIAPDGRAWTLEYSTASGTPLATAKSELQQLFAGFFGAMTNSAAEID